MPLYIPTEDLLPADLIELLADQLTAIYTDAETRILAEIARRAERALEALPTLTDRLDAVRALREHAQQVLDSIDPDLAYEVIRIAMDAGTAAAVARLGLAKYLPNTAPFSSISTTAVAQLALDLKSTYDALHLRILRWEQDAYQALIAGEVPNILLGTTGRLDAQKNAIRDWLRDGIPGFIDKSDRPWRIGSYVEMATRTAVSRALTDAGVYRMQQAGINLVTVKVGNSACSKCGPWIGKILSTDGVRGPRSVMHATEDRLITVMVDDTLDHARELGLMHPNCRCTVLAYLPGLSIPNAATSYDPAREAARDQQREIERQIRQTKRDLDLTTDPVEREQLRKDIRDLQATMRAHVAEHNLPRKPNREQVRFADGRAA